ncbi:hypothetical protein LCGC14_2305570 [marine sediment metagenome]|uniref:ATPase dynein-related AAA domain-containing protein n=1 Tax=marine sediment metagenome TaxID=412755 RepID=A0A0F9CMM9_9ZZZZ
MFLTDKELCNVRDRLESHRVTTSLTARQICTEIRKQHKIELDPSTVRHRFKTIGEPIGSKFYGTGIKLKVGMKVKVVGDLAKRRNVKYPGIIPSMLDLAGTEQTIEEVKPSGCVTFKVTGFQWHPDWVEVGGGKMKDEKDEIEDVKIDMSKLTPKRKIEIREFEVPEEIKSYIPLPDLFEQYITRPIDKRLAVHYELGFYPLTQGKQGTGKTFSHMYYAYKRGLPFFLFSCHEEFKLEKLFGDKTIRDGTIRFQETEFVIAIQNPSVILFDEINALSQANTYPFHALLQNRCLFIKDANDGKGRMYHLHTECRIGFAQNPKSAKYIGGNIRASNFLGRCTYITYPEFTKKELHEAVKLKYPDMTEQDRTMFIEFYKGILECIDQSQLPVDVSIRQLNNIINLWLHGMPLKHALEDGLSSIVEAISQPKAKDALWRIAEATWGIEKIKKL